MKVTAPYNFVPLCDTVFVPEWGQGSTDDEGLHDTPFEDGVRGTLDFELEAVGPLFVRAPGQPAPNTALESFRTPDGRYAIPGSSIRGLLRNVVQIASFCKLAPLNETRYGFRDLHNPQQYIRHMAVIDPQQRGPAAVVPLVGAAWLRKVDDVERNDPDRVVATLEPCSFAKVEYALLRAWRPGFEPGLRQSAPDKYRSWGDHPREVRALLRGAIGKQFRKGLGEFSLVTRLVASDSKEPNAVPGTLVFTGQPQAQRPGQNRPGAGQPKHHDFFFYDTPSKPPTIEVTARQFQDFEFIHSDAGQQGRTRLSPNAEWKHWSRAFEAGQRVPVFYLLEPPDEVPAGGRPALRSFGLAMMFRLAYRFSPLELANRHQKDRQSAKRDLSELLFGMVPDHVRDPLASEPLKGRVSIGLAVAKRAERTREVKAVLGAPKPTFYPNYVEQGRPDGSPGASAPMVNGKPAYKTYMDADARLRGWKRYRPQTAEFTPSLPDKATDRVITRFVPLAAGARFEGRIRIHNLKPEELGALLWALDFGRRAECEHMLGMARSLGFGRTRFRIVAHELYGNRDRRTRAGDDLLEAARAAFVAWATKLGAQHGLPGGWEGSVQIAQLIACATPLPPDSREGRHLSLAAPVDGNQFVEAKKAGLALPPAIAWTPPVRAPKAAAAPALVTTKAALTLARNTGEWSARAKLGGREITLFGKGFPGISDAMREKGKTSELALEVEPAGGNRYRIKRVLE